MVPLPTQVENGALKTVKNATNNDTHSPRTLSGEGKRRSAIAAAAAKISTPRRQSRGVCCRQSRGVCCRGHATGRGIGGPPPRRTSAPRADSRGAASPRTSSGREGGARLVAADNGAGRPLQTPPCACNKPGVSPRTSGGEGRGSGPARTAAQVCCRERATGRASERGC